MKPLHWTYAGWLTVLRVYAGLFWLSHGIPKFLDGASFMPPDGFMPQMVQRAAAGQTGFYHDFLVNVVIPNVGLFAELTRLGEVCVGLSLLFGLFTRLGGVFGCLLALNYMAAMGEFSKLTTIGSIDAVAFMLSFMMLVLPVGRVLGVDAFIGGGLRAPRTDALVPEVVDEPAASQAPAP